MDEGNLRIALTGAMGSGKSVVAQLFREQGARIVDADKISRRLLAPSEKGWCALRTELGEDFLNDDSTVDRPKLRAAIFSDEPLRQKVNAILHPMIRREIDEICRQDVERQADRKNGEGRKAMTIVEVPLLFEVGWQDDFDLTIVVFADEETCLARVMARDGVARSQALAAFASQMGLAEKVRLADHVIDNSGDLQETSRQVEKLYLDLSL
jgi:dephospho-CoA kinase